MPLTLQQINITMSTLWEQPTYKYILETIINCQKDSITKLTKEDFEAQALKGLIKYGVLIDESNLNFAQVHQHAKEEIVDLQTYQVRMKIINEFIKSL